MVVGSVVTCLLSNFAVYPHAKATPASDEDRVMMGTGENKIFENAIFENNFVRYVLFRAFNRWIKFLGTFYTFQKISLVESGSR